MTKTKGTVMRPSEAELRSLYETKTDLEIGLIYGVTGRSVYDWRKKHHIQNNPKNRSHNLNVSQIRELSLSFTDNEIGSILGVSGRSIANWRERNGIPQQHKGRRRPTATKLDIDFFSSISTEEQAYILGLLSADGYVTKTGRWVALALQERDAHILDDIKKAMNSEAKIADKISKGGFAGSKPQKVLTLCSKKLVSDLSRYGIIPRKSYTLCYPDIPSHLDRHFIRGLMDGDGHIGTKQFSLLGTQSLLHEVQQKTLFHSKNLLTSSQDGRGYPRLVGSRRDRSVLQWIYKDATIFLKRKHQTFIEFWS